MEEFSLHKKRIEAKLDSILCNLIDMDDVGQTTGVAERKTILLTRALAAYCLIVVAHIEPKVAAAAVVDGGNDKGLDAIYIDQGSQTVFLVQSKWPSKIGKSISQAEVMKFCSGVSAVLKDEWDLINPKIESMKAKLQAAVLDGATTFVTVLASPTTNLLEKHAEKEIAQLCSSLNAGMEPIVFRKDLNLTQLYGSLTSAF